MGTTLKHALQVLGFLVLLAVMLHGAAYLVADKGATDLRNDFFHGDDEYEVIILGSSKGRDSTLPQNLWRDEGIAAYNLAAPAESPEVAYWLLKDALTYTTPKLVIVETYGIAGDGLVRDGDFPRLHWGLDSIPLSFNKLRMIFNVCKESPQKWGLIWPFIDYHSRWHERLCGIGTHLGGYIYYGRGGAPVFSIGSFETSSVAEDEYAESSGSSYAYDLLIAEECASRDIDVLFLTTPFPRDENQLRLLNNLKRDLAEYDNVRYVNAMDAGVVDTLHEAAADGVHLNYRAAGKMTSWLGAYLKENYELGDYSDVDSFRQSWLLYLQAKKEHLQEMEQLEEVLAAANDEDFHTSIEVYDKRLLDVPDFAYTSDAEMIDVSLSESGPDGACCRVRIVCNLDGEEVLDACFAYSEESTLSQFSRCDGS